MAGGEPLNAEASQSKPDDNQPAAILLIGVGGMLATAFEQLLQARQMAYDAPALDTFDLTKPNTIVDQLTGQYKLVINAAAYTDVDGCEKHETLAHAINATGPSHLAQRCKEVGATLVHFSTDYVFNGTASEPYPVSQARDPVNAYGHTKAVGERLIQTSGCRYLIIRTSWLYAPWGKNFVLTMAKLSGERDRLTVVDDQRGRPTSAQHLADATMKLLDHDQRGTFHVTDGGECTWYEFAKDIIGQTNPNCTVEPCTTDAFPRPAKRPAYSVLDLSQTEVVLGPMPSWQVNLKAVLETVDR